MHRLNTSDGTGPSTGTWLLVAMIASLVGGMLPGYLKLLAVLPLMAPGLGVFSGRPHWAILPAILFCPFNFESLISRIGIPFLNPFNLAWVAAAGALVLISWRSRRFPLPRTSVDRFLLLNILVSTIAVIQGWKVIPTQSFPDVFMVYQQWLQWMVFFWVVAGLVRSVNQARLVVFAVAGMVAVAAFFGIKDYLVTRAVSGGAIERSQGLFGQANYAASFFAYYLPVIAAILMARNSGLTRLFLLAVMLSGTVACVMTFGRGGLMALGLGLLLLTVLTRSKTLLLLILICGLLVSADPSVRGRFSETTSNSGAGTVELDDSSGARLIAWEKALDLARQRPLTGWGFLSFRHIHHPLDEEAAAQFGHGRMDVHNGHLNTLVSGGLLGSVALYLQFGGIVVWCLRIRRTSNDSFTVALASGIIASVLAIMVVNLFGTRLYDRQLMGYFWVLLGALHGAEKEPAEALKSVT